MQTIDSVLRHHVTGRALNCCSATVLPGKYGAWATARQAGTGLLLWQQNFCCGPCSLSVYVSGNGRICRGGRAWRNVVMVERAIVAEPPTMPARLPLYHSSPYAGVYSTAILQCHDIIETIRDVTVYYMAPPTVDSRNV